MSEVQKRSQTSSATSNAARANAGPSLGPGKQSLIEQTVAVQRRATGDAGPDGVHDAAAKGVATPTAALPHAAAIQGAFGRHDVSGIQAHVGGDARASADSMGADAYATGNHVVLGKGTDLHTVAHEAAHVVQQRGGVQLKGGVGEAGDAHERHADDVASLVVQGKSAEGLLDRYAGGAGAGPATAGAGPVQHKLTVGGADQASFEATWGRIANDPQLAGVQDQAQAVLRQWIDNKDKYEPHEMDKVSANRMYKNDAMLVSALAGEVKSAANLEKEGKLAKQTIDEGQVNAGLASVLTKLQAFQAKHAASLPTPAAKRGRYGGWAYPSAKMTAAASAPPADLRGRIAMIADYALAAKGDVPKKQWPFVMTGEQNEARPEERGVTNANEASPWAQQAREHNMPLSAGPSATTAQVLALAELIGCDVNEKTCLAWAIFSLWNDMPLHMSGTHRFHEVMDVAAQHGVPYTQFAYSEPPKGKDSKDK
jgi:hypothetical protein